MADRMQSKSVIRRVPVVVNIFVHAGALLAAVAVPANLFSLRGMNPLAGALVFMPALTWSVVIGLPLYGLLRWRRRFNFFTAVLAGFITVAVPMGYITWPLRMAGAVPSASVDGVTTMIDGVPTPAGWAFFIVGVFYFAIYGAIGGAIFWGFLKFAGLLRTQSARARWRILSASALSVVSVAAAGTVLYLPDMTRDRSCHGRYMPVTEEPVLYLHIPNSDWPRLRTLLGNYSAAHHLSFRDTSKVYPGAKVLYVSICDDSRIQIEINEQRWASNNYENSMPGWGVGIVVRHPQNNQTWKKLNSDLTADLRAHWPDDVRFRDGGGYLVSPAVSSAPDR